MALVKTKRLACLCELPVQRQRQVLQPGWDVSQQALRMHIHKPIQEDSSLLAGHRRCTNDNKWDTIAELLLDHPIQWGQVDDSSSEDEETEGDEEGSEGPGGGFGGGGGWGGGGWGGW